MDFIKTHPIISSLLAMLVISFLILIGLQIGLDFFTQHGQWVRVPNIKGLKLSEAQSKLEAQGLKWEISDTVNNSKYLPNTITDVLPEEGSKVKPNRIIFLTINSDQVNPFGEILPQIENQSERLARSLLSKFSELRIMTREVDGDFDGIVVGVETPEGKTLHSGGPFDPSKGIVLLISRRRIVEPVDSLLDSINMLPDDLPPMQDEHKEIETQEENEL